LYIKPNEPQTGAGKLHTATFHVERRDVQKRIPLGKERDSQRAELLDQAYFW